MSNPTLRFKSANGLNFPDTVSCTLSDISKYSKGTIERKNCLFIGNEQLVSNLGGATLEFRTEAKGTEFNNGDILFGNIRPYLKKVWLSDQSGIASPDVLIFKVTDSIPGYLKCILSSERFFNHVAQGYKGSKMPRGDKHQIMDFRIQCPCLEEQQKIASFFSTLDQKIELNERKLEALEKLKKGLLQKIFKQELKFNHSNQSWANVCLIDIADVRDGTHDSPSYVPSGFPLVTSKNLLKNGEIDIESTNKISVSDYDNINKRSKVDVGDILFGMIGTIGRPVLVKESGFAIKNVALIKPKADAVNNVFLYYLFRSDIIFKQLCENKTGGNQKFVSLKIIRNLLIPLPDKDEQNHIADFLSKFDKKLAIEKQRQKLLLDLKKGLMQQMFV